MKSETIIGGIVVLLLLGVVGYFFLYNTNETNVTQTPPVTDTTADVTPPAPVPENEAAEVEAVEPGPVEVIGESNNGNDIIAYHYGSGDRELLLVAGVHGAYAANTSQLANELRDHLEDANIPDNLRVTVIPVLNPDGLEAVYEMTEVTNNFTALANHDDTIIGRFNANEVDLNRNFDCDWAATSMWRSQEVSGGSAAFSETEAAALRDYVNEHDPIAAIVWFSAEGKVYPSACGGTPSTASTELAATFALAAGYPSEKTFDAYAINGDMVNWLAKQGVPAISVLLSSHNSTDRTKNITGLDAVLKKYAD